MILRQYDDGFVYTSDSMFLYDFIGGFSPRGRMLDVGCGCGVLGLLTARDHPVSLTGLDIDADHCRLAALNAAENGIKGEFVTGDFREYRSGEKFDVIVSNPPFYDSGTTKSPNPRLARARYDEYLPLDRLIVQANKNLAERGELIFCYDAKAAGKALSLLESTPLRPTHVRFVHPTAVKEASLVMIRCLRLSRRALTVLPPIVAMQNNTPTPQAAAIFAKAATTSLKCPR